MLIKNSLAPIALLVAIFLLQLAAASLFILLAPLSMLAGNGVASFTRTLAAIGIILSVGVYLWAGFRAEGGTNRDAVISGALAAVAANIANNILNFPGIIGLNYLLFTRGLAAPISINAFEIIFQFFLGLAVWAAAGASLAVVGRQISLSLKNHNLFKSDKA